MLTGSEQVIQERESSADFVSNPILAPMVGSFVGCNENGDVLVEFKGGRATPAKLVANVSRTDLKQEPRGRQVLLIFENGDPERPIIIGLMEDRLDSILSFEIRKEEEKQTREVIVDKKRVVIQAEQEVLLKCGKGSILIREDGKIIIKGTDVLSRSSGSNRVKGASVSIN